MSSSRIATTSYLLGNLHCPSCVAAINALFLQTYGDQVSWVSPNLVTSVVTVEHIDSPAVSVRSMEKTLEDAGFEVCAVSTTAPNNNSNSALSRLPEMGESSRDANHRSATGWSRLWRPAGHTVEGDDAAAIKHRENCEACRSSSPDNSASTHRDSERLARLDDKHLDVLVHSDDEDEKPAQTSNDVVTWKATMSIGGMTCASCSNGITKEIEKLPGVTQVVVNLIGNSAAVTYMGHERSSEIAEAIEDLGYDATLDKTVRIDQRETTASDLRTIQIKIDGMFCPRCPGRIIKTLNGLGSQRLTILEEPTVKRPVLKLSYRPDAPTFTIRHILQAVSAADPSLHPAIYHEPSFEEQSRAVRKKHEKELLWREILTIIVAIPTFILGIVYMSLVPHHDPSKQYLMRPWTSGLSRLDIGLLILATPVYFFAADIFHVKAIKELHFMWRRKSKTPIAERFYKFGSMDMLMSLGTSIAYLSSVAQMIAAAARQDGHVPEGLFYFDSVVFLTLFLLAGRLIESYTKSKTGDAVESLMRLRPTTAILVENASAREPKTTTIPLDQLEYGDVIRVPNGTSPPADGTILVGVTAFDESSLTGESRPVKKKEGDEVFSGTINKSSVVTVRVTSLSGKSMLDQIVDVVREGQTKRAPMEHVADTLTSYFVPFITLLAVITWVVWMGVGFSGGAPPEVVHTPGGSAAFALQFAIAVFVVACPCGLALAAPTAIFVGGGLAAKYGVLVKGGGEAFEKAHKVDCVVFDKTGTLTLGGEPQITDSVVSSEGEAGDIGEQTILSAIKSIEENSSHPIAKAIVGFCGSTTPSIGLEQVEELPGRGMKAMCKQERTSFDIAIGNELLMNELGVRLPSNVSSSLQTWKSEAKSIALAAIRLQSTSSWAFAAAYSVSDPIRSEAATVIKALQAQGTRVWMLSGDNVITARAVAERVGIPVSNVLAEVLPSEKAAKVTYLQATLGARALRGRESTTRRATVAMVGDGINDAPALTTADVGVAVGSGSDVAISSADFVLASSNLAAVLTLLDLSRRVVSRIRLNFGWALVYNMIAVPVAAGCLYPLTTSNGEHVRLDPVWASLAMALSSISVVLSSLALRTRLPVLGFRPQAATRNLL